MDAPSPQATTSFRPERLRVDARAVPEGRGLALAASAHPRLSWSHPLVRDGQRQTGYEVAVVSGSGEQVWSSARVSSEDVGVRIPVPLDSNGQFRFAVRTRDERGTWSSWSSDFAFETGPLDLAAWQAEWVSHPPLHTLRRRFTLNQSPVRAVLHLTAQGLVRATVNAHPVNAEASDPSRADFVRALYRSYDVTDLVHAGENIVDFDLARGEWERTGLDPRVLAVVVTTSSDGSQEFHGTGSGMQAARSAVVTEDPFYLEAQDLLAPREFVEASALRLLQPAASPLDPSSPPSCVLPDPSPPIRTVMTLHPTALRDDSGARRFDVGMNVAGRSRLTLDSALPAGTQVQVVHGEHLDANGRLDTTNLMMPHDHGRVRQAVSYVLSGRPGEVLTPWFCYHGFRYLEITGLPPDARVTVEVDTLHSDLTPISELVTDDDVVNRLIGLPGEHFDNVHGIPEDCPTREQAGWTGDTASVTEFTFSAFDAQAFFDKWLGDLRTSQLPTGQIPAIAPDVRPQRTDADPVWGAALQRVAEAHWLFYGDHAVIEENTPALRAWADFLLTCVGAQGTVDGAPISYGHDWLGLQQTPPELHHTAATIDALRVLADFEDLLGNAAAAGRRRAEIGELRRAAHEAFVDSGDDLVVGNGSQGSYAAAIDGGWLSDDDEARAADRIDRDVRARGNRVSSGFATTRSVVRALGRHGRAQTIHDTLHQPAEPGVGAMLDHGPGTFWECWWIDPENTGTGSLDHIGLGGPFAGWAWTTLTGIRPTSGGYSRFVVEPQFVSGVHTIDMRTRTVRGDIHLRIERDDAQIELEITVPVGATAEVRLPGSSPQELGAGWHRMKVDAPPLAASIAPEPEPVWVPPARTVGSADVDGPDDLATRLFNDAIIEVGSAALLPGGVRCMPVPHEQPFGDVLLVHGSAIADPTGPRIGFPLSADLSDARFVFAMVDLCVAGIPRASEPYLRIVSADGTSREASAKTWPAGWNRVSVDVDDWAGAREVVAIEVGLRHLDASPASYVERASAFHLGPLGWSVRRRTWP